MKKVLLSMFLFFFFVAKADANVALNKTATASSQLTSYPASKMVDGNQSSYWEGSAHSFPYTLTVDLEDEYDVTAITLKLPTSIQNRSQGVKVLNSNDNTTFTEVVPTTTYNFANQPIVISATSSARYWQLKVTSNTSATAGQLGELEIEGELPPETTWAIQSVDAMKYTKDIICNPVNQAWIENWVDKAVEVGATHVAIAQPYDSPTCGDSVAFTNLWVSVIRAKGLKVWHRHMPLKHEGLYGQSKSGVDSFAEMISAYILTNSAQFEEGDIFTPIPEPQNAGVQGVTCSSGCFYDTQKHFNHWLQDMLFVSELSFKALDMETTRAAYDPEKVNIGYYGFDGFVAWGHNNPDWTGIITTKTLEKLGGTMTIDHYPEAVGTTMAADLAELLATIPSIQRIVIGEWGTIQGGNTEQSVLNSMGAAATNSAVVGFNYWQPGPGGNEALWLSDWTNKSQFDEVLNIFRP